jgi:hypothetical protein
MKLWPLLAAGLTLVLAPSLVRAEDIKRELTDNERFDYSVAESRVILRGQLLEIVDAMVPATGAKNLVSYRYALVQPQNWLKGAPTWVKGTPTNKPIVIGFDERSTDLFQTVRGWAGSTDEVVFFLKKPAKDPPAPAASSKLPSVEYVLEDSPYLYQRGVMKVGPGDETAIDERMKATAASRSLDSLVVRSSLALLGTAVGEGACRIEGKDNHCERVRIDRMLAGSTMAGEVPVYGLFDGPIPTGQSIYFLRQTSDDSYEILSFRAGVMPVENGKVEPLGKPLNDVLGHIKTVVRATRGPGD